MNSALAGGWGAPGVGGILLGRGDGTIKLTEWMGTELLSLRRREHPR